MIDGELIGDDLPLEGRQWQPSEAEPLPPLTMRDRIRQAIAMADRDIAQICTMRRNDQSEAFFSDAEILASKRFWVEYLRIEGGLKAKLFEQTS